MKNLQDKCLIDLKWEKEELEPAVFGISRSEENFARIRLN